MAADSVYGVGDIEMALRRAGKGYVLGVGAKHSSKSWAKAYAVSGTSGTIAEDFPPEIWQRLSVGACTKGERFHDWAYVDLADLEVGEFNADLSGV